MPLYEYEHLGEPCARGRCFEELHSAEAPDLVRCPDCGQPVRKRLTAARFKRQYTPGELRDRGFTKLVRRDDGIYENVTAKAGQNRIIDRDRPETMAGLDVSLSD